MCGMFSRVCYLCLLHEKLRIAETINDSTNPRETVAWQRCAPARCRGRAQAQVQTLIESDGRSRSRPEEVVISTTDRTASLQAAIRALIGMHP